VAGSCEYGDEPSGSGATELVSYTGFCLEGMRKATNNLSQNSRSPGRDLNPEPPE
jgi:hypothetical protein